MVSDKDYAFRTRGTLETNPMKIYQIFHVSLYMTKTMWGDHMALTAHHHQHS